MPVLQPDRDSPERAGGRAGHRVERALRHAAQPLGTRPGARARRSPGTAQPANRRARPVLRRRAVGEPLLQAGRRVLRVPGHAPSGRDDHAGHVHLGAARVLAGDARRHPREHRGRADLPDGRRPRPAGGAVPGVREPGGPVRGPDLRRGPRRLLPVATPGDLREGHLQPVQPLEHDRRDHAPLRASQLADRGDQAGWGRDRAAQPVRRHRAADRRSRRADRLRRVWRSEPQQRPDHRRDRQRARRARLRDHAAQPRGPLHGPPGHDRLGDAARGPDRPLVVPDPARPAGADRAGRVRGARALRVLRRRPHDWRRPDHIRRPPRRAHDREARRSGLRARKVLEQAGLVQPRRVRRRGQPGVLYYQALGQPCPPGRVPAFDYPEAAAPAFLAMEPSAPVPVPAPSPPSHRRLPPHRIR